MKKVLHISKFFYPYYGGIEDVVYTIIQGLKGNYQQRVICFSQNSFTSTDIVDEIPVKRIGTLCTISSQPIPLCYTRQLKKEIETFLPDIIHIHLPNPYVCACLMHLNLHGARLVVHWHADILGKHLLYSLTRPFETAILKKADHIVATSREYVALSAPLQPFTSKISILPNTINENKFSRAESDRIEVERIRSQYGNRKIVLFIGRHVEYKGIRYLIESSRYLKDDTVVLIGGTGPLTHSLANLASSHPNIVFIGRIPNEQIKYYMQAASVFAFPSVDRREAFGVALAEALYCGLPAVSFHIDGSGTNWVNQNGQTGIVVPNRDVKAYADALQTLLDDEELRTKMGKAATAWVSEHFLRDQVLQLSKVWGK